MSGSNCNRKPGEDFEIDGARGRVMEVAEGLVEQFYSRGGVVEDTGSSTAELVSALLVTLEDGDFRAAGLRVGVPECVLEEGSVPVTPEDRVLSIDELGGEDVVAAMVEPDSEQKGDEVGDENSEFVQTDRDRLVRCLISTHPSDVEERDQQFFDEVINRVRFLLLPVVDEMDSLDYEEEVGETVLAEEDNDSAEDDEEPCYEMDDEERDAVNAMFDA